MLRWIAAFVLTVVCSGVAQAQERALCFEPGTTILTVESFKRAREIADEAHFEPKPYRHVRLRGPRTSPLFVEAELELAAAGVGFGRIERVEGPLMPTGCVSVEVITSDQPFIQLWHYHGLYFEQGSTAISPVFAAGLRYVAVGYRPDDGFKYCIDGHSDTLGTPRDNLALSLRRADSVARELVRLGVRAEDIFVRGFGETMLAQATADEVSEPLNRRATVELFRNCPTLAH